MATKTAEPAGYWDEPDITINGGQLSFGQALSVRVAVELFMLQLDDPEYRKSMGTVADNYHARLSEVRLLMAKKEGC